MIFYLRSAECFCHGLRDSLWNMIVVNDCCKLQENHTLHSGTYLYSPYMAVPPPRAYVRHQRLQQTHHSYSIHLSLIHSKQHVIHTSSGFGQEISKIGTVCTWVSYNHTHFTVLKVMDASYECRCW